MIVPDLNESFHSYVEHSNWYSKPWTISSTSSNCPSLLAIWKGVFYHVSTNIEKLDGFSDWVSVTENPSNFFMDFHMDFHKMIWWFQVEESEMSFAACYANHKAMFSQVCSSSLWCYMTYIKAKIARIYSPLACHDVIAKSKMRSDFRRWTPLLQQLYAKWEKLAKIPNSDAARISRLVE